MEYSSIGKALGYLHLNYETQGSLSEVKVTGDKNNNFNVNKMRFAKRGKETDKTTISYNEDITISNIPMESYDYVVNGKSAIEWILDRYQIKTDKDSGIVNDPNDWAKEHNQPRYILDLLLSVITVSVKTVELVKSLPKIEF